MVPVGGPVDVNRNPEGLNEKLTHETALPSAMEFGRNVLCVEAS